MSLNLRDVSVLAFLKPWGHIEDEIRGKEDYSKFYLCKKLKESIGQLLPEGFCIEDARIVKACSRHIQKNSRHDNVDRR